MRRIIAFKKEGEERLYLVDWDPIYQEAPSLEPVTSFLYHDTIPMS